MDCEVSGRDLLERVLLDASAEPTDLPLSLLKTITSNFSDGHQIGRGGFATVYKGLLHKKGTVAVKRLSQEVDIDEKKFNREVDSLMRVKHENIVRFLGYCADTQGKVCNVEGKNVMAEVRQRLLCFEYLPKGSLDRYITDASHGLEWNTRYQIMKGICEGLHYLHNKSILHLDLKPANILLNDNMVPKIADFGLSRCFDEKQSEAITSKVVGSPGYMAPEFFSKIITLKLDIYSLGVIFLEILTGHRGYTPVENVLESWKNRLKTSNGDKRLKQVRVCAEMGIKCTDFNPAKRPDIWCIIENLEEIEHKYGFIETELCTSSATQAENGCSEQEKVPGGTNFEEEERDAAKEVSQVDLALLRTNVLNDAFHISHDGVVGTINNFRLGRLSNVKIEWDEINAAWGQAALLLHTMAQYFTPKFQYRIKIHPKGSYPRVTDIHNNTYELFGPVNLFSSTLFDNAMTWFLTCLQELAEFAISLDKENKVPPEKLLKLPYKIDGDKVGSHTIILSFNKIENWTKALKYMLCNLKWVLYWFINNTSFGPPSGPVHALVHSLKTNQAVDPIACPADWCLVGDADLL